MNDSQTNPKEITRLLKACREGNPEAMDKLMEVVHKELYRQAHHYLRLERANHTLETKALVNEVYLELTEQHTRDWQNLSHFFAITARFMRRILLNHARNKNCLKRGEGNYTLSLEEANHIAMDKEDENILALNEALEKLEKLDKRQGKIVELRYFSGLTIEETAESLNISTATVKREWESAKAWLYKEING